MTKAEQFIIDCTRTCSNELVSIQESTGTEVISYHEWLTPEQALRAVEMSEEKLKKAVELADAMYDAAFNLTTDASQLHKAMDDYHHFIIHEYYE